MNSDPASRPGNSTESERATIARALSAMSVAQLLDLRTTAHRFKHLPFARLMDALFRQEADRERRAREQPNSYWKIDEEQNLVCDPREPARSKFVEELFGLIDHALAAKEASE